MRETGHADTRRRTAVLLAAAAFAGILSGAACAKKEPRFRNVIFFIGDGMSVENQVAASRYLYGKDEGLAWHGLPGRAYVATWDVSSYNKRARKAKEPEYRPGAFMPRIGYDVSTEGSRPLPVSVPGPGASSGIPATDSASAATALATGYKTDSGNISWKPGDPPDGRLRTIMEDFRDARGASIGVVTTVPFNHATPAAFVAHNVSRNNYYSGRRGYSGLGLGDEMILETRPDVVIGGGHPGPNAPMEDPKQLFMSTDLLDELRSSSEYVLAERQKGVDGGRTLREAAERAAVGGRKLFGLFGGEGGNFAVPRPADDPGRPMVRRATNEDPSLAEAVVSALLVMSKNRKGFFLMVEQGDIDWASHDNDFASMIGAVSDLDEAVKAAAAFVDRPGDDIDWSNTIFVVTSDHATGGLRLVPGKELGAGDLPRQSPYDPGQIPPPGSDRQNGTNGRKHMPSFRSPYVYPDGEIEYSTLGHTNDLVPLATTARAYPIFREFKGSWYPGPILDNTQVNQAIRKALGL